MKCLSLVEDSPCARWAMTVQAEVCLLDGLEAQLHVVAELLGFVKEFAEVAELAIAAVAVVVAAAASFHSAKECYAQSSCVFVDLPSVPIYGYTCRTKTVSYPRVPQKHEWLDDTFDQIYVHTTDRQKLLLFRGQSQRVSSSDLYV